MALSIVDVKAHGNSVTERAPILATLRRLPNQAFPLSMFPCEESRLERLYAVRVGGPGHLDAAPKCRIAQRCAFGASGRLRLRDKLKAFGKDFYREVGGRVAGQSACRVICLCSRAHTFIGNIIGGISLVASSNTPRSRRRLNDRARELV